MKRIIFIVLVCIMCFSVNAMAESITLPNGQTLNIDNLNDTEIAQAISTARKSMQAEEAAGTVMDIVKGVNPTELEAWGKLISGTIKTICDDLSITVNDFVKTPVGMGIAASVVYKIAGKDFLDAAWDVVIVVPLWFLLMGIYLFLGWYFFANKTFYKEISYNEKGKKIKKDGYRSTRYNWESSSRKESMAYFLIIASIITTVVSLLIVLV